MDWPLALAIVALILAAVDDLRSRGTNLTTWAVVALALAAILPHIV